MKLLKVSLFVFFVFFKTNYCNAQKKYNIIPYPNNIKITDGHFTINKETTIYFPETSSELDEFSIKFQNILYHYLGIKLSIKSYHKEPKEGIVFKKTTTSSNYTDEAYQISINNKKAVLSSSSSKGLFYAIQTFRQLIPIEFQKVSGKNKFEIGCVDIQDAPRFSYRGIMLDPARHFLQIEDLKKYIDAIALYKFNTLHLHLSDDQGWRVEIKKYPKLAQIASVRNETEGDGKPHKGYYTQDELKDLVAYAKERFVEIIPEIDIPGHSQAVITAYPELTCFSGQYEVRTTPGVSKNLLCAGNDKVFEFYDTVFKELAAIFPSKKFHIGGDEAPLDHWNTCEKCQQRITDLKLESSRDLMSYFFQRISESLTKYGKSPLIWYELDVPFYPKNSTMYSWRMGLTPKVIEKTRELGYKLICSPGEYAYFDYPQWIGEETCNWMPILPLEKVYKFNPGYGLSKEKQEHIIGVEATIWGEYVKDINRAFYMTFPRALALSEAGWTQMENRSWIRFKSRLYPNLQQLLYLGINYRPPFELGKF